ncbi:MAG: SIMPL domain-containing protein, partial [Flavobacteriaceae bacterium]
LTLDDLGSHFKKYFLKRKDIMKSKSYKLKLFDAQMAGKVIVGLEDIGISNVDLGKMEYSKIEELRLALKSMAVAKAKRQAEYLMEPLQQNVGGALHISDRFFHTPVYQTRNMAMAEMAMAKSADYAPIDIDFGPIKVESEVAVKFKIE